MPGKERAVLDLKCSICTDNPTGSDTYPFSNDPTQVVQNTGIERNGGVTNIYEQQITFPTAGASTMIAKDGTVVQVDAANNVRLNDQVIGNVGPYAVSLRGAVKGYSDAAWTAGNTIIGIVKVGSSIRVDELNPATMAVLNTRSTAFAFPSVTLTNVFMVKYPAMNYADSLTFVISNSAVDYFLKESDGSINLLGGVSWATQTLAAGTWNAICWSPQLGIFVAVGSNTVATSPDGVTWTTHAIGAVLWNGVVWSPQLALFVACGLNASTLGPSTSPDGVTWTPRVLSTNNGQVAITWSPQLGIFVVITSTSTDFKPFTSTDGATWTTHTSATLTAIVPTAIAWSPALGLFVAVGSGSGGHYAVSSTDGINWTAQTLGASTWLAVCWSASLGKFVAVGANSVATSTNGTSWSVGTIPNGTWRSVVWSPQLSIFAAVSSATAQVATSPDGITWTLGTLEANQWFGVEWSPALNEFAAVSNGATHYAATGQLQVKGSNFCWKFAASKYLIGCQGLSGSFFIGDIAATMTAITDATWTVIDQFAGTAFSRAILTFPVKKNASNLLTGIGEVGHNQAGTYNSTPTYYGVALAAVTVTIGMHTEGPGYTEATFTRSDTGTAIYYYQAPIMGYNPGQWYDNSQSQTQTLVNGYGRLTDFVGNTLGNTCSLRVVMINGQPSLLSAGVIGTDTLDCLGVPVTNVGELDETYLMHVVDNGSTRLNCVYRYGGILFFFVIQRGVTNTLQAVSDNVYMVNCLSPVNAIDVQNRTLNLGVCDYNGRILFRSAAAIIATVQIDGIMQGDYANSIDTGPKLITQTFSAATSIVPGIELPSFIDRGVDKYGVNVYLSTVAASATIVYALTYQSFNVSFVNGDKVGQLQVNDTRLPFAMGYQFQERTMQTEVENIFTGVGVTGSADINFDYLCYELGNDTPALYQSFVLFGQTYLFDGKQIWFASFNGSLFNGRGSSPVCPATGMILIASSPVAIFFLSTFDNSLYIFDGGRSLTKYKRMNDIRNSSNAIEAIVNGVYNTRDNSLLLQTASTFVWIRDNIVTQNNKKANQTAISLYDTINGITISNNTLQWIYSFSALSASTVVPLTWQSAYHSLKGNELSNTMQWVITLFSPDGRIATPITLRCHTIDQDGYKLQAPATYNAIPADWDGLGFLRLAIHPQNELALAVSLQVDCPNHVVITDVSVAYGDDAQAVIQGARSL